MAYVNEYLDHVQIDSANFNKAYLEHIHGKTVTSYSTFSQRVDNGFIRDVPVKSYVEGFGVICGEYAFISGGAGHSGYDVQTAFIVKLDPSDHRSMKIVAIDRRD